MGIEIFTKEKDTFRYKVKLNGKVIQEGTARDFNRRASEIEAQFPGATIKQVGRKVTMGEAEKWLGRKK